MVVWCNGLKVDSLHTKPRNKKKTTYSANTWRGLEPISLGLKSYLCVFIQTRTTNPTNWIQYMNIRLIDLSAECRSDSTRRMCECVRVRVFVLSIYAAQLTFSRLSLWSLHKLLVVVVGLSLACTLMPTSIWLDFRQYINPLAMQRICCVYLGGLVRRGFTDHSVERFSDCCRPRNAAKNQNSLNCCKWPAV